MASLRNIGHGVWQFLDGLRRVLHLLLLFFIFGVVLVALHGSIPSVPQRAALVVAPEGRLVEQLSGDPLQRALEEARGKERAETLLWDLTDSIRAAAKDKRIPVLVLDLEHFEGGGQPTLEELARAIREFRASGKKVIAVATSYLQAPYYIAAQADEIYVDPMGFVLIDGYDGYRMFFKDALDKLGVDINVFRVGAFKSAVEVFTRNDMSEDARQNALGYLSALWTSYQAATTKARKLPADAVATYVTDLPKSIPAADGDAPQVALKAGLVTGVKTRLEVEHELIAMVGEDESDGSFHSVSDQDYARILHAQKKITAGRGHRIGVIVAEGEILDGDQPPGTIGGESTARLIRTARMDDNVRAVVLRVDSPGGSVNASEQIYQELKALKAAGKPLIVSMANYAASGGYYISAPADEIWASPATVTGSIGIFAIIPTVPRTLAKVGVNVDGVGTTPLSGQLRLDRPLGAPARALLQSTVERGYEEFIKRVASGRKKTRDQVDEIGQGRVWAGVDGKRLGLVDELGSFDDAVKAAARRAKLTTYDVHFIEPELTWAEQLAMQLKGSVARLLFSADGNARALAHVLTELDPLAREVERLSHFTARDRLYAYCFCGVP
ncbi:MAG TPA: signal peptide peptidase SppA [Steroidobacteraceae bacterium]|jgi:protease-4|nr:signal peptide peptidase SppA [Steroidobacteraceae bacterium]